MAHFIIDLLKTKQLDSLWMALSVLLKIMPYKLSLRILHEARGDLRHGEPENVARVCEEVMKGSNFLVQLLYIWLNLWRKMLMKI